MARAPKKLKAKSNASSLIAALQFVSIAQKDKGSTFQTHCQIANNQIVAFDGNLSAGHYVEDELTACPQTKVLKEALLKCGQALSITQLDNKRLAIKSDKFSAFVPCFTDEMPLIVPDLPVAPIDDRLKTGFEVVGLLAKEGAERVVLASILLNANSMIGTNGHIVVEYWHGINLPCGLVLPKSFISAILKTDKTLSQFGFSSSYIDNKIQYHSLTFYFSDNSWIKTQLYNEDWPDTEKILGLNSNAWLLPESFFDAINILASLASENRFYFFPDVIKTSLDETAGASYEVEGLLGGKTFSAEYLKLLCGFAKCFDFTTYDDKALFFGENIRGAIISCRR